MSEKLTPTPKSIETEIGLYSSEMRGDDLFPLTDAGLGLSEVVGEGIQVPTGEVVAFLRVFLPKEVGDQYDLLSQLPAVLTGEQAVILLAKLLDVHVAEVVRALQVQELNDRSWSERLKLLLPAVERSERGELVAEEEVKEDVVGIEAWRNRYEDFHSSWYQEWQRVVAQHEDRRNQLLNQRKTQELGVVEQDFERQRLEFEERLQRFEQKIIREISDWVYRSFDYDLSATDFIAGRRRREDERLVVRGQCLSKAMWLSQILRQVLPQGESSRVQMAFDMSDFQGNKTFNHALVMVRGYRLGDDEKKERPGVFVTDPTWGYTEWVPKEGFDSQRVQEVEGQEGAVGVDIYDFRLWHDASFSLDGIWKRMKGLWTKGYGGSPVPQELYTVNTFEFIDPVVFLHHLAAVGIGGGLQELEERFQYPSPLRCHEILMSCSARDYDKLLAAETLLKYFPEYLVSTHCTVPGRLSLAAAQSFFDFGQVERAQSLTVMAIGLAKGGERSWVYSEAQKFLKRIQEISKEVGAFGLVEEKEKDGWGGKIQIMFQQLADRLQGKKPELSEEEKGLFLKEVVGQVKGLLQANNFLAVNRLLRGIAKEFAQHSVDLEGQILPILAEYCLEKIDGGQIEEARGFMSVLSDKPRGRSTRIQGWGHKLFVHLRSCLVYAIGRGDDKTLLDRQTDFLLFYYSSSELKALFLISIAQKWLDCSDPQKAYELFGKAQVICSQYSTVIAFGAELAIQRDNDLLLDDIQWQSCTPEDWQKVVERARYAVPTDVYLQILERQIILSKTHNDSEREFTARYALVNYIYISLDDSSDQEEWLNLEKQVDKAWELKQDDRLVPLMVDIELALRHFKMTSKVVEDKDLEESWKKVETLLRWLQEGLVLPDSSTVDRWMNKLAEMGKLDNPVVVDFFLAVSVGDNGPGDFQGRLEDVMRFCEILQERDCVLPPRIVKALIFLVEQVFVQELRNPARLYFEEWELEVIANLGRNSYLSQTVGFVLSCLTFEQRHLVDSQCLDSSGFFGFPKTEKEATRAYNHPGAKKYFPRLADWYLFLARETSDEVEGRMWGDLALGEFEKIGDRKSQIKIWESRLFDLIVRQPRMAQTSVSEDLTRKDAVSFVRAEIIRILRIIGDISGTKEDRLIFHFFQKTLGAFDEFEKGEGGEQKRVDPAMQEAMKVLINYFLEEISGVEVTHGGVVEKIVPDRLLSIFECYEEDFFHFAIKWLEEASLSLLLEGEKRHGRELILEHFYYLLVRIFNDSEPVLYPEKLDPIDYVVKIGDYYESQNIDKAVRYWLKKVQVDPRYLEQYLAVVSQDEALLQDAHRVLRGYSKEWPTLDVLRVCLFLGDYERLPELLNQVLDFGNVHMVANWMLESNERDKGSMAQYYKKYLSAYSYLTAEIAVCLYRKRYGVNGYSFDKDDDGLKVFLSEFKEELEQWSDRGLLQDLLRVALGGEEDLSVFCAEASDCDYLCWKTQNGFLSDGQQVENYVVLLRLLLQENLINQGDLGGFFRNASFMALEYPAGRLGPLEDLIIEKIANKDHFFELMKYSDNPALEILRSALIRLDVRFVNNYELAVFMVDFFEGMSESVSFIRKAYALGSPEQKRESRRELIEQVLLPFLDVWFPSVSVNCWGGKGEFDLGDIFYELLAEAKTRQREEQGDVVDFFDSDYWQLLLSFEGELAEPLKHFWRRMILLDMAILNEEEKKICDGLGDFLMRLDAKEWVEVVKRYFLGRVKGRLFFYTLDDVREVVMGFGD